MYEYIIEACHVLRGKKRFAGVESYYPKRTMIVRSLEFLVGIFSYLKLLLFYTYFFLTRAAPHDSFR